MKDIKSLKGLLAVFYILSAILVVLGSFQGGFATSGSGVVIPQTNLIILFSAFIGITLIQVIGWFLVKPFRAETRLVKGSWSVLNHIGIVVKLAVMAILIWLIDGWALYGLFSGIYFDGLIWSDFSALFYTGLIHSFFCIFLLGSMMIESVISVKILSKEETV